MDGGKKNIPIGPVGNLLSNTKAVVRLRECEEDMRRERRRGVAANKVTVGRREDTVGSYSSAGPTEGGERERV